MHGGTAGSIATTKLHDLKLDLELTLLSVQIFCVLYMFM